MIKGILSEKGEDGSSLQQHPTAAQRDELWGFVDYPLSAAHHMPQNVFVPQISDLPNKSTVL